jgi:PTS system nitrogen regulatory IIA component
MDLVEMVAASAVAVDVAAPARRAALERAAELLAGSADVPAADVLAALLEREALGTTGFGAGTAIPHGRVAGLTRVHGAILRLSRPVGWDAIDSLPVDIIFALAGPDEAGAGHLKALARASRALRDTALVAKFRGSADAAALWSLVANADARQAA